MQSFIVPEGHISRILHLLTTFHYFNTRKACAMTFPLVLAFLKVQDYSMAASNNALIVQAPPILHFVLLRLQI